MKPMKLHQATYAMTFLSSSLCHACPSQNPSYEQIDTITKVTDRVRTYVENHLSDPNNHHPKILVLWDWDQVISDVSKTAQTGTETLLEGETTFSALHQLKELNIKQMVITARWVKSNDKNNNLKAFKCTGEEMLESVTNDDGRHPFLSLHPARPIAYHLHYVQKDSSVDKELCGYVYNGIVFCPNNNKLNAARALFMRHPEFIPEILFYTDDQRHHLKSMHTFMQTFYPSVKTRFFHLDYQSADTSAYPQKAGSLIEEAAEKD